VKHDDQHNGPWLLPAYLVKKVQEGRWTYPEARAAMCWAKNAWADLDLTFCFSLTRKFDVSRPNAFTLTQILTWITFFFSGSHIEVVACSEGFFLLLWISLAQFQFVGTISCTFYSK
jgi:hypothetical protein